ncbi:DUF1454 family protein [Shigella flexneri]
MNEAGCTLFFLLCSALTVTTTGACTNTRWQRPRLICWLEPLLFNLSISQFREDFNSQNPSLPLNEFVPSTAVRQSQSHSCK